MAVAEVPIELPEDPPPHAARIVAAANAADIPAIKIRRFIVFAPSV
jgi:hypothetical protein